MYFLDRQLFCRIRNKFAVVVRPIAERHFSPAVSAESLLVGFHASGAALLALGRGESGGDRTVGIERLADRPPHKRTTATIKAFGFLGEQGKFKDKVWGRFKSAREVVDREPMYNKNELAFGRIVEASAH